MKVCSVPDCQRPFKCKSLCAMHYDRFKRTGTTDRIKTENGEPFRFAVNSMSIDTDECILWPYATSGAGYAIMYTDEGERIYAHVFICKEEYGPRPSEEHQVAHSCGKGFNGCINKKHLRWATVVENHADKILHGTTNRGEKQGLSKITKEGVLIIRSLKGKAPQREIAAQVGVSSSQVGRILRGENWGWLV